MGKAESPSLKPAKKAESPSLKPAKKAKSANMTDKPLKEVKKNKNKNKNKGKKNKVEESALSPEELTRRRLQKETQQLVLKLRAEGASENEIKNQKKRLKWANQDGSADEIREWRKERKAAQQQKKAEKAGAPTEE